MEALLVHLGESLPCVSLCSIFVDLPIQLVPSYGVDNKACKPSMDQWLPLFNAAHLFVAIEQCVLFFTQDALPSQMCSYVCFRTSVLQFCFAMIYLFRCNMSACFAVR